MFGHGETAVHHRFLGLIRNAQGQTVPSFADPVDLFGIGVAPGAGAEPVQGMSYRVVSKTTIYTPAGASIGPQDQVTVRGVRYSVDGDASGTWGNPFTGSSFGSAVALKRVTG